MAAADYRLMTEATGQRIAIALENLAGFGAYLTTSDVVNNLDSTATDKPLSAAQGKALNDNITSLIHTNTYSGTTDNTGDIGLNLSTSSYVPIAFKITGGNISKTAVALFFHSTDSAKWWVKFVSDENVSNITNTTVEGTLYYLVL